MKILNRFFIFLSLIGLSFTISSCSLKKQESKPNIIIFFTDDQGYGDVGCYGAEGFKTPHLDELASNGIRFTDFYVAASVCTPSRAALLTGKYPKQLNLHEAVIFPYSENGISAEETTLPEILKTQGYSTAMFGKWHLGHYDKKYMPNNHGFDYFYGVPYSNDMDGHYYKHIDFQSPPLPYIKNEKIVAEGLNQDQLTKIWTEATVEYIHSTDDKPFFIYLAHNMPHVPWHTSKAFKGISKKGIYGDIMQEIDWSMGQIIQALKEKNIFDNTIVIFTSDNGQQNKTGGGSAGPLRGSKAQTWEGGMRVPAIISWPAKLPKNEVCVTPVSTMDILPTITKITNGQLPKDANIKGRDITPVLLQPTNNNFTEFELVYYNREGNPEAIRQGDWKLHISKSRGWNKENGEFPLSLYNLREDISESNNLAEEYPQIAKKLKRRLNEIDNQL